MSDKDIKLKTSNDLFWSERSRVTLAKYLTSQIVNRIQQLNFNLNIPARYELVFFGYELVG